MTHAVSMPATIPGSSRRFVILLILLGMYVTSMLLLENGGRLTMQESDIFLYLGCLLGIVIFIVFQVADLLKDYQVFLGVAVCLLTAGYMLLDLFDAVPWQ